MHIDHHPDTAVSIVQVTDAHLGVTADAQLLGMNTEQSLNYVLDLVSRERAAADLILCTGDLSNNGSEVAYRRFCERIQTLKKPNVWLPGNHDLPAIMQQTCACGEQLSKVVTVGRWQIVMLDSSVPYQVGGQLADSELQFLEKHLTENQDRFQLICLHHHVLPVGCAWLDEQRVSNAAAFFELLERFAQVKGVLSGHVHQEFDQQHAGLRVMTTPSSCIQFATNSDDFKVDHLNPGYRWLELQPDGGIKTAVSRVTGVSFTVDYDSLGY